jgi:dolichol-phosphate mannosyltransferase
MYDIIIPTYNEKQNIRPLFTIIDQTFRSMDVDYNIVVVDDNSPDGTYEEVLSFKDKMKITAIKREKKLGLGTAYKSALEECTGSFVIIMDADLSHDPGYIKTMIDIQKEEDCDIVTGSRYMGVEGSGVYGWGLMRRVISRGANNISQIVLGINTSDVTGSFRMYKKKVFETLIGQVKSVGYSYQMEIIFLAERYHFSIRECPIIFMERMYGRSKLQFLEIIQFMYIILYLFLRSY